MQATDRTLVFSDKRSGVWSYLEVYVLNSSHDDSIGIFLRYFKFSIPLQFLNIEHSPQDFVVESLLVAETFDILCGMRIDMLQRPCEFIVKAFNDRHNATGNFQFLPWSGLGWLLIIFPCFCILDNYYVAVLL